MNISELIYEIVSFWKNVALNANVIPREVNLPLEPKNIIVLTGGRRVGKTYILYDLIRKLLANGVDENKIFYINFEDERVIPQTEFLTKLIPTLIEKFVPNGRLYLLLDEIHRIPRWESWVHRQYERGHFIYISGSTTQLQPHNIGVALRGRSTTYVVYPLSFKEFLNFKKADLKNLPVEEKRGVLKGYLNEYLTYGGYPEITLLQKPVEKISRLQEYFRATFYRDIIEANRIENEALMEVILKILMNSIYFGSTKLYNTLKSIGISTSKSTIMTYKRAIESSYLMFQLELFSYKIKDRLRYPKKIYFLDHGMRRAISASYSNSQTKALENAIFIALQRNINPVLEKIYYYKTAGNYEVDFVIVENTKPKKLIQVTYTHEEKVLKREERALLKAMKEFQMREGYIVTNTDYEHKKEKNEKIIRYIPTWKFLLKTKNYLQHPTPK